MNVLFVVSECVPFIKTGGLADVAGSLPQGLQQLETNVIVMMPLYGTIANEYKEKMKFIESFTIEVGWRQQYVGIKQLHHNGIQYLFIDNEYYFNRDSLYGHFDDGERFSYFNKAVLEAIPKLPLTLSYIHCHDWHTGMIPFLLREKYADRNPCYQNLSTVFTIHNLQFQGIFPREILGELLNVDQRYFTEEYIEFNGLVSFMKAGINFADFVTTVSPTYCQEIQTPYFGEKLDGLLRTKGTELVGILNGIDDSFYNPITDPFIVNQYDSESIDGKVKNKLYLQKYFQLEENEFTPVIVMVTRLTKQKGLDLVTRVFHEIMGEDLQFILIGTGDYVFEHFFQEMAYQYPTKMRAYIGFNEQLAHLAYAGADVFLMPSQFEPCGLGQLIAMKYGTVPVVRETGGLNDSVHSYNEITQTGNGFSFTHFNAHDMLFTIKRALSFYKDRGIWNEIIRNAMTEDNSWRKSASKYQELYSKKSLPDRSESDVFKQGTIQEVLFAKA